MARPAAKPGLSHRPRPAPPDPARVQAILKALHEARPDARVELDHDSPFRLLIATILSAQCTDARVNQVTPSLFRAWPDAAAFARAPLHVLEEAIRSTGFFRAKARAIKACCRALVGEHGGEVPRTLEELIRLPGVGRKTANVVLGAGYGIPSGIVVDTHVARVAGRLGLTRQTDPVKIERDLMPLIPSAEWIFCSIALVLHGRYVCQARLPRCSACPLRARCPSRDLEARTLSARGRPRIAAGRSRRRTGPRPAPDRS
ncbi:MAG: endonuclease III [Acidobacteria bacterium]|nr:endonuclease III [Acidobacteriota bacterium]